MNFRGTCLLVVGLSIAPAPVQAGGVTIYVAPPPLGDNANDGSSPATPYATIQFAFVQAMSGDEIRVLPGTYNECIDGTTDGLGAQKNLAVVAEDWVTSSDRTTTIIDGNGAC